MWKWLRSRWMSTLCFQITSDLSCPFQPLWDCRNSWNWSWMKKLLWTSRPKLSRKYFKSSKCWVNPIWEVENVGSSVKRALQRNTAVQVIEEQEKKTMKEEKGEKDDKRTILQKIWDLAQHKEEKKNETEFKYLLARNKMNVRCLFRNLELYIPFDATDEMSRVLSMSLST